MSRSRGRKGRQSSTYYQPQPSTASPSIEPIRRGEIIDLGEMGGAERAPLTASFNYFGDSIRVHEDLSEIDVIDFFESAEQINSKASDPAVQQQAMTMIKGFVRRTVHPGDFDRFWSGVKSHRQTGQEVIDLMFRVIEGVTGNPSSPRSASSAGPTETMLSSPPPASEPGSEKEALRQRYIAQIERFEAQGTGMGAAMAAQIAVAAEARGVDVSPAGALLLSDSV
jgi:hypothetical protein